MSDIIQMILGNNWQWLQEYLMNLSAASRVRSDPALVRRAANARIVLFSGRCSKCDELMVDNNEWELKFRTLYHCDQKGRERVIAARLRRSDHREKVSRLRWVKNNG